MAKNYSISFMSLRAKTVYTVSVGGGSGAAVALKGGAQPFTTQESDDDDPFCPIRTQTGYLRIVDDGYALDGTTAFDWKDMIPATDTSRPVTLSHVEGGQTIVDWQGFLQAQTFSGALYGNPQEREFPVQCPLTVLGGIQASTTETQLHNFAYLLKTMIDAVPSASITEIIVQGGADAQQWLLKMFDWQNFLNNNSNEAESARYNYGSILEDVCKFWGWTIRIMGTKLYLICADDLVEQTFLTMTYAQLTTMAGGTAAGTTSGTFDTTSLTGNIFASVKNDEFVMRGYHKATVKADVNPEETVVKFAPESVREQMDAGGYTWTQGEGDYTGYFSTPPIYNFTSKSLDGYASNSSGFVRRQVFSTKDEEDPTKADMILITRAATDVAQAGFTVRRAMSYSRGSLSFAGQIYTGEKPFEAADKWPKTLKLRVGIGITYQTAKWWYLKDRLESGVPVYDHGWSSTPQVCEFYLSGGNIGGAISPLGLLWISNQNASAIFKQIPVEEGLYGFIFIDFMGMGGMQQMTDNFQIGNFEVKFSRDETILPSAWNDIRPRTMSKERNSQYEYMATNDSRCQEEWNADCIFASDNNMEYGFGLLMNPDGRYMATAKYNNVDEHPEQHLANRVAAYYATSKRKLTLELQSQAIPAITPKHMVNIAGNHTYPIVISRNWRDDETYITTIEMPEAV